MRKFLTIALMFAALTTAVSCSVVSKRSSPPGNSDPSAAETGGNADAAEINGAVIDEVTEEFIFGEWEVVKFLGFDAITKDDVMWPDGEAIIGKSLVISAALFSSKNFGEDYAKYAAEVANPQYQVQPIMGESEFSARLSPDADVSIRNLSDSDEVLLINVVNPEDDSGYGALYSVNKERLIISLNCDYFELAKRRK